MTDLLSQLLAVGGLALLIAALLAPFETLGWWAGWFGDRVVADPEPPSETAPAAKAEGPSCYVVYLSGIGSLAGDAHSVNERALLRGLEEALPNARVIGDVFPYSAAGIPLTGQRMLASFWTLLQRKRMGTARLLRLMINLRNLYQVLVAADTRYGPLYDFGIARRIARSLLDQGFEPERGTPVFILGVSGGAQVAIGVAAFVSQLAPARLEVVSIGGVMAADPGLDYVTHLMHFYGTRDRIEKMGAWVFPRRWPMFSQSSWNRAIADGRLTTRQIGPMTHNGRGGYLDDEVFLKDGRTHFEVTLTCVVDAIGSRLERYDRLSPKGPLAQPGPRPTPPVVQAVARTSTQTGA